jgi:hypothetical protein
LVLRLEEDVDELEGPTEPWRGSKRDMDADVAVEQALAASTLKEEDRGNLCLDGDVVPERAPAASRLKEDDRGIGRHAALADTRPPTAATDVCVAGPSRGADAHFEIATRATSGSASLLEGAVELERAEEDWPPLRVR